MIAFLLPLVLLAAVTEKRTEAALYRVKEAAAVLALSDWEVRRLCETGELSRRFIGKPDKEGKRRRYRVTVESVEAYLKSLPEEPA